MAVTVGEVRRMLEQFLDDRAAQVFLLTGKVIAIDQQTATVDVEPLDGSAMYQDVRLMPLAENTPVSLLMYPKKDSLVTIVKLDEVEAFVLNCQEVERLELEVANQFKMVVDENGICKFNNGDNGGLIIINKLQQEINKNSQILQTILSVLAVPVTEAGNGLPSVLQQTLNVALQGATTADLSNVTNDKIQH